MSANVGLLQLTSADGTNLSAAIITGGANGTDISEVCLTSGPTPVPGTGVFLLMMTDGTTVNMIDKQPLDNLANSIEQVFRYTKRVLPAGWQLKAKMVAALPSGASLHVTVFGEDRP